MTYHSERARVENEAANWAVLLADDPHNNEQLRQFQIWLNASALHAQVWARTLRAYRGLGMLPPRHAGTMATERPGRTPAARVPQRLRKALRRGRRSEQ